MGRMDFDRGDWRSDTPQDPERRWLGGTAMGLSVACALALAVLAVLVFALAH